MLCLLPVLLLIQPATSTEHFESTLKLIKGNAAKYKIEYVKNEEDLEYPRNNKHLIRRVKRLWENYYSCLVEMANKEKKIEIVHLIEGQFTQFHCEVCPKPFQDFKELEWKYKPLESDVYFVEPEELDLVPEMELTANKTLKIFNVIENFAGLYVCYQGKYPVSCYILEVSKNDTIEKVDTSRGRYKKLINLEGITLNINYRWSHWTECSSCATVGRQFKYGSCLVSFKRAVTAELNGPVENLNSRNNLVGFLSRRKTMKHLNSTSENHENIKWVGEILERFATGIPCTSQYLPKPLLKPIKNYTAVRVLVRYCSVPCEGKEIFEVLDKFGKVIETANNSAGIYSYFQNIPHLPNEIERRSVEAEFGKDIIIQCPRTLLSDTPVTWKINKKVIFPEVIANESNGRITIDLINRIHLKHLRLKDSHIYSCWQRNKLTGTVHLNVYKKFKIGLNHHITLIGMAATIGTFLFVGAKIITRELKSRKK